MFAEVPKAPRGYKPVYISHYGRHGSRYLVNPGQYESVYSVLFEASAAGKLTAEGERIWQLYSEIYPSFDKHEGELTPLGAEQHRGIAARMVQRYPSLFRRGSRVVANSTNLERTMLSMLNFTQTLQALRPRLDIQSDASRSYMGRINQHTLENPSATEYDIRWKKGTGLWMPAYKEYVAALINPEPFCRRLFTDYAWLQRICKPLDFEFDFCDVAMNLPSCGLGYGLLEAFTYDELMLLGRLDNYRFYVSKSRWPGYDKRACYLSESVLGDIIDRTAEDLADGVRVRLRFGHDGCMMALFALLRLDGWNAELEDPADSWKVWDVSRIPMASNLQLVFFAPRRLAASPASLASLASLASYNATASQDSPLTVSSNANVSQDSPSTVAAVATEDLLVLPLLNEEPLPLPIEPAAGNYFYRWSDFLNYCEPLLLEARSTLSVHK